MNLNKNHNNFVKCDHKWNDDFHLNFRKQYYSDGIKTFYQLKIRKWFNKKNHTKHKYSALSLKVGTISGTCNKRRKEEQKKNKGSVFGNAQFGLVMKFSYDSKKIPGQEGE